MDILIIGGGLFVGRVLVLTACKEHHITVANRGHHPLRNEAIREVQADRRDPVQLQKLAQEHFDVVIDVCGYEPGDVRTVFSVLEGCFDQYLFISSLDVEQRGTGAIKDESTPYETRKIAGDIGRYIHGKIILEQELMACAAEAGVPYTIVRCAIIYGPFNYAKREPWYVQEMCEGRPIYCPSDAEGEFQLLYVKDLAAQVLALCKNEGAYREIFHLCSEEVITYDRLFALLREMDIPGKQIEEVSVAEAEDVHFPYPLTAEETERYTSRKVTAMTGIPFSDFEESMRWTLEVFRRIFVKA